MLRHTVLLNNALTAVLVITAMTTAGMLVKREFFSPQNAAAGPTFIHDWQPLFSEGLRLGPPNAQIEILEFADYQCEFCARVQPTLDSIASIYGQTVAIVYRHLPLEGLHPEAFEAAKAAVCAEHQGSFEALHRAFYAKPELIGIMPLAQLARDAGVQDSVSFANCMRNEATAATVRRDMQAASALGISRTPTFVVQGNVRVGYMGVDEFQFFLERALGSGIPGT